MAARENTARDVQHEPARHGRHGRPRPFGGRFRLPTLRFSGAAMAMSTVVGISIATTLLLNEQQSIGRRAGVARVGTTPPPTPGTGDEAEAVAEHTTDAPPPSGRPRSPRSSGHPSARPSGPAAAAATPHAPAAPSTPAASTGGGQASAGRDFRPASGTEAGSRTETQAEAPVGPSPSARPLAPSAGQPGAGSSDAGSVAAGTGGTGAPGAGQADAGQTDAKRPPGLRPTTPVTPAVPGPAGPGQTSPGRPLPPAPSAPDAVGTPDAPDTSPPDTSPADPETDQALTDQALTDQALTGAGLAGPLGRDGLRHSLGLTVSEPVTALQAEFRLAPGELAPGSGTVWTDLPGAVVTTQQERGTLVYRFTTPPGTDVEPGRYTFVVRGSRPADQAGPAGPVRGSARPESWSASAFGIGKPRAVAALGGFGRPLALPAQPPVPALH